MRKRYMGVWQKLTRGTPPLTLFRKNCRSRSSSSHLVSLLSFLSTLSGSRRQPATEEEKSQSCQSRHSSSLARVEELR